MHANLFFPIIVKAFVKNTVKLKRQDQFLLLTYELVLSIQ